MPRPHNMTPLPPHPAIIDSTPTFMRMYKNMAPCSRIKCPNCGSERWYPWLTIRQLLKRPGFNGVCISCMPKVRDYKKAGSRLKRRINSGGYVLVCASSVAAKDRWIFEAMANRSETVFEHRMVMALRLGRPLLPSEQVHHLNGVRDDNSPDNLELWVKCQPPGQRLVDVLAWARDICHRYAPLDK